MPTMLDSPITTADQLFALDEPGFRHELVRGELLRMSRPGPWHAVIAANIVTALRLHIRQHKLGLTMTEAAFRLTRNPDTVRCPDAAFVTTACAPTPGSTAPLEGAPEIAVEVVSPSNTFEDLHGKALQWMEHGTRLVWVVESITRTICVYRPDHSMQVLTMADTLVGEDVLPGFSVPVADVFLELG